MSDPNNQESSLDTLYKQSATEQPAVKLDQAIRNDAIRQLQNTSVTPKPHNIYRWQSIASVAAVMVISVYLFFDVRDMRDQGLDVETFTPQPQFSLPAPAAEADDMEQIETQPLDNAPLEIEAIEMNDSQNAFDDMSERVLNDAPKLAPQASQKPSKITEAPKPKAYNKQQEMERAKKVEARNKAESQKQRKSIALPTKPLEQQLEGTRESALMDKAPIMLKARPDLASPESMLVIIQTFIAEGNMDEAKKVYEQLRLNYPEHPVPESVLEHFEE